MGHRASERRDQQHHDSAGPENRRHAVEGLAVVLDVFQCVQTHAAVGAEPGQVEKRRAACVAGEGVQVAPVRVAFLSRWMQSARCQPR